MAKITLNDLENLTNDTSVINSINNNNALIEASFENTLSRDGTSPNQMQADLDMNSNRIVNLPQAVSGTEPVRKQEFDVVSGVFEDITLYVAEAQASADAAAASAGDAASQATSAQSYANAASASASDAAIIESSVAAQVASIDHPLKLYKSILDTSNIEHFWNGPIVYDATHKRFWRFFSSGYNHTGNYGTTIQAEWSRDGFLWDKNTSDVISTTGVIYDAQFAVAHVFPSGRIGIAVAGYDVSDWYFKFCYTDNGRDWTATDITEANADPLVLTGEAWTLANGDVVMYGYGYYPATTTTGMKYLKIVDEGTSFVVDECWASTPAHSYSEPTVVKKSNTEWLAFGRDDRSDTTTAYNAWASKSTDGLSWTAPVDSGILLGSNPIKALYVTANDRLWIYGCFRGRYEDHGGAYSDGAAGYGTPANQRDGVAGMATTFATVFNASGVIPVADNSWTKFDEFPYKCTGQITYTYDDLNRVWATIAVAEDLNVGVSGSPNTTQKVVLMSPTPPVTPALKPQIFPKNVLHNPFFRQRFSTAGSLGTYGQITDRWFWDGNASYSGTSAWNAVSYTNRLFIPFRVENALTLTSSGGQFCRLSQIFSGAEYLEKFADRPATVEIWLTGSLPPSPYLEIKYDLGGGGSAGSYQSVLVPLNSTPVSTSGVWRIRRKFVMPTLSGATIGTSPTVTISLMSNASGSWDLTLYGMKIGLSSEYSDIERMEEYEEDALLDRFRQQIVYNEYDYVGTGLAPSADTVGVPITFPKMFKKPTSIAFTHTQANNDFYFASYGSSIGSYVPYLTALDSSRAQIVLNVPSISSGTVGMLTVGVSVTPTILISTGI